MVAPLSTGHLTDSNFLTHLIHKDTYLLVMTLYINIRSV